MRIKKVREEYKLDFSMFENMSNRSDTLEITRFPKHTPLAMAYVPLQQWKETYNLDKGFEQGTIFPELNFPFKPEEGCYEFEK